MPSLAIETILESLVRIATAMRLIEFSSAGCPYCQKQKEDRVMERLASTFRSTSFTRVDCDKRDDLAELFKIEGLPSYVLIDVFGKIRARVDGAKSYDEIASVLRQNWAA